MATFEEVRSGLLNKYNVDSGGTQKSKRDGFDAVRKSLADKYSDSNILKRQNAVMDWLNRYNQTMQSVSDYNTKRNGAYALDVSGGNSENIAELIEDFDNIREYAHLVGVPNATAYLTSLKNLQSDIKSANDFYGQFDTEEDYLKWDSYSTIEKRQATYQQNIDRIDELTKRREELTTSAQPQSPYTTNGGPAATGMPYGGANMYLGAGTPGPATSRDINSTAGAPYGSMPQYQQKTPEQMEIEEIDRELARLNADVQMYERGNTDNETGFYYGSKVVDDYSAVMNDAGFGKYSASDFKNPTSEDMAHYDAMMDTSSWYEDNSGNTRNRLGEIVTDTNRVKPNDSRYQIVDPLGAYMAATPEELANMYGDGSTQLGVLNQIYSEGYDGDWDQLTPDEVSIYYTLLGTQGQDAAMKYLSDMKVELNRRGMAADNKALQAEFDAANGWKRAGMSALSVPANLIGGVFAFADDLGNQITGNEVNPYSSARELFNYGQKVREYQSEAWNDAISWRVPWINFGAGDFYNAMMSSADMYFK